MLKEKVREVKNGSVSIVMQDGTAVQLNAIEYAGMEDIISEENFRLLLEYMRDIKYGNITLLIQDGRAVQIEKSEKIRIK